MGRPLCCLETNLEKRKICRICGYVRDFLWSSIHVPEMLTEIGNKKVIKKNKIELFRLIIKISCDIILKKYVIGV